MEHLYIHIPFCLKKCAYCNFYSVTNVDLMDRYIEALGEEMIAYSKTYGGPKIKTVYMGGGTPGILSAEQFLKITKQLKSCFEMDRDVEFTIETNPETFEADKFTQFKKCGVTRVSIGVQSFDDSALAYLGRIHSAKRAREVLKSASGMFENVSLDLIYALPNQTLENVKNDIKEALSFAPKHFSCYELTFEKNTPLYADTDNRPEDDEKKYRLIGSLLKKAGYIQYEISNYAMPNYECGHNLAYWSNESYLGLGASAHSYDKNKMKRWANKTSINDYIDGNRIDFEESAQEIDKIIMGLRRTDGMEESSIPKQYKNAMEQLIEDGLLKTKRGAVAFTEKGVLLSNRILLEIMQKGEGQF